MDTIHQLPGQRDYILVEKQLDRRAFLLAFAATLRTVFAIQLEIVVVIPRERVQAHAVARKEVIERKATLGERYYVVESGLPHVRLPLAVRVARPACATGANLVLVATLDAPTAVHMIKLAIGERSAGILYEGKDSFA